MEMSGAYRLEEALAMPLEAALWLLRGRRSLVRAWQQGAEGPAAGGGGREERDLPGGRKVVRFTGPEGMEALRRLAREQGPTRLGV